MKRQLFEETQIPLPHVAALRDVLIKERFRCKLKIPVFFALAPSARDYDVLPLPAQIIGLYFSIHPLRFVLKAALAGPQFIKHRF